MVALALAGCSSRKADVPPEAPAAAVDAGAGDVEDAGPPMPQHLEFAVEVDGAPVAFEDGAAEVDAGTSLRLTTPVQLKDYRVRLLDWEDKVVTSDDEAEVSTAGTSYRVSLPAPLATGRRYTLMVDASVGPVATDVAGREFDDVRLTLRVRGEVQKPPPPARKPAAKRRKHR